jgi:catechol-2,3-dioxygenase
LTQLATAAMSAVWVSTSSRAGSVMSGGAIDSARRAAASRRGADLAFHVRRNKDPHRSIIQIEPINSGAAMPVRRLNHAVLYVNGLDREIDFYTRTLGFEVRMQIPGQAAFLRSPGSVNDHDLGLFDIGVGHVDGRPAVGLYHLAWEVGTLGELVETRQKLLEADALVGESDHRLSKSLYAKDPSGIEFEVLWRVPVEDWESELAQGNAYTVPLDWERTLTRWDANQQTGAAAGSAT